jgi:hypothetical protein
MELPIAEETRRFAEQRSIEINEKELSLLREHILDAAGRGKFEVRIHLPSDQVQKMLLERGYSISYDVGGLVTTISW